MAVQLFGEFGSLEALALGVGLAVVDFLSLLLDRRWR
jgi:hypothetical protein